MHCIAYAAVSACLIAAKKPVRSAFIRQKMNAILYRTYLKIQVIYHLKISDLAPFRSHRGDE